ncbi:unnamed protein product [Penicillium pancosmium]
METQDSIDIAKLQRDALGLVHEHEPSQPFSFGLTAIDRTSPNNSSHLVHSDIPSHGDAPPTDPELSTSRSSNTPKSPLKHQFSLPATIKHAKASMSPHTSAATSENTQPAGGPQLEKMDSVEGDPGDTQVVSQSVYDSIIRQNGESVYGDFLQNGADNATLMTLHEGDSGHLDILAEFNTLRHERNQSPTNDDESVYGQSPSSPIADHSLQPEFFPESQRFLTTTPATGIKKKNQTPGTSQTPSASRNPLLADLGSSGGLLMGLSQAFKNTQAPSSPLVHGLQSELASDRPSPNIPIQQRIHNPISSPLVNFRGNFARDSSEPNLNYISMKESQHNRDKSLGERLTRSEENLHSGDQIDQDFYKEPSFVEAARRKREIDEETAAQFAALNTPSRPRSDAGGSSRATSLHIHEDDAIGMHGAGSEEETEQEEEDAGPQVPQSQEPPSSSMEEDKENYIAPHEPAVATSNAHDRLSQALGIEGSQPAADNPDDTVRQDLSGVNDSDNQLVARSSQVMVKNSQQTPQGSPRQENAPSGLPPVPEDMEIDTEIHVARTSPTGQGLESPSLDSRPGTRHSQIPGRNSQQQSPHSSHRNESEDAEHRPTNGDQPESSHDQSQPISHGALLRRTGSYPGEKSSSLPSQVKETPIHLRPSVSDISQMTKVPNTSPDRQESNRWNGECNENNEDDDLPPMFPVGSSARFSQQRPSQIRAQSSPIKCKPSILSSPSGRQRRRLMEIASDTSPQVHGKDKVVEIDMSFFTNDPDFNALIQGSPTRPRKRRRGNLGQSFDTSEITLPATPAAELPQTITPIQEISSPVKTQSSAETQIPAATARRQPGPSRRMDANVWEIESSPQQIIPRRSKSRRMETFSSRHRPQLQKNPQPRSEPSAEAPAQGLLQPSEAQREKQSERQSESQPQSQSASQLKNQPYPKPFVVIRKPISAPSSELTELDIDSDNLLSSDPRQASAPLSPRPTAIGFDERHIAPCQIISLWPDRKPAYYPGTCLGMPLGTSAAKYSVKLEDSLPIEVNINAVKRLELRIGDAVKVEMPGIPRVTHIVRGLEDKITKDELNEAAGRSEYPITDIFGYSTVVLGPKNRESLPAGYLNKNTNVIRVPIARIYLDKTLWHRLKDRDYTYQHEPAPPQQSLPQTPVKASLPASPSSRFSRNTQGVGLFSNMAFAASYKDDEATKNNILRLIQENGGSILHSGFTELFESSSVQRTSTSPTKGHHKEGITFLSGLNLTDRAQNIGFTCLIANTHSRREKFMQALALNIPCLSGRWVEDCVTQGCILDWGIYLLPAGESMYLDGATKSRMLIPTPPSKARLAQTFSARPKLLDGKSVLIVMGRGKAEEKREAYVFLTFALGASRVERVPDVEAARSILESEFDSGLPCSWDFVYADDADRDAARTMLVPRPMSQRVQGKKRKKSAAFAMDPSDMGTSDTSYTPRVVGAEFVCQSLILGQLYDE